MSTSRNTAGKRHDPTASTIGNTRRLNTCPDGMAIRLGGNENDLAAF